jgi:hypothetical protein
MVIILPKLYKSEIQGKLITIILLKFALRVVFKMNCLHEGTANPQPIFTNLLNKNSFEKPTQQAQCQTLTENF